MPIRALKTPLQTCWRMLNSLSAVHFPKVAKSGSKSRPQCCRCGRPRRMRDDRGPQIFQSGICIQIQSTDHITCHVSACNVQSPCTIRWLEFSGTAPHSHSSPTRQTTQHTPLTSPSMLRTRQPGWLPSSLTRSAATGKKTCTFCGVSQTSVHGAGLSKAGPATHPAAKAKVGPVPSYTCGRT